MRGGAGVDALDGDIAAESGIPCPPHLAHAARAERCDDLVRAKARAGGKRHLDLFRSSCLKLISNPVGSVRRGSSSPCDGLHEPVRLSPSGLQRPVVPDHRALNHYSGDLSWLSKLVEHRSEEHTSELQSPMYLVCRLL